nr:trimethylamine methyltransferase [Phycisphaerae bacterium]NIU24958.1 trimethylamine methyltransferase [candidate division KSB1 bacterium]NIV00739.1 trimethylamine methyltransferase [Phycisphaerae bacterium]NIV69310.1 trimethylamine methyltransferase [Phycisphaerae bacterium]NIW18810.1 trimethylamine methyltransferase [candidate division KSB1 bacterium]
LATGYEKFVLDCEVLGMLHKLLQGLDLSDDALAMDSIRDVPPGGHHLGTPHTMAHFRTAFYRAELFDYNSAEQWQEEGSLDAVQRANAKYKKLLREYEAPDLDEATDEELQAYIAKRKKEIKPEF